MADQRLALRPLAVTRVVAVTVLWLGALKHLGGIAAYRDHQVRFGVVESINTTSRLSSAEPEGCETKPY